MAKKPVTFWIHFLAGVSIYSIAALHIVPKLVPGLPSIFFTVLNYIILLSIPIAISLYLLNKSNPNNTKYTKIYIILASVLWFIKVITLLGVSYMNIILYEKISQIPPASKDTEFLQTNIRRLNTSPTLEKRREYAQYLYWFTGNKFEYLGEENNFLLFQPSKNDETERQKVLENEQKWVSVGTLMRSQIKSCTLWAIQYILAMGIALFVTLAIAKYKKHNKKIIKGSPLLTY
jgi:hypothetical protein